MEISNELYNKIAEYVDAHQPTMYWDYRDQLSKEQIVNLIENPEDGLRDLESELFMLNDEYIWETEKEIVKDVKEEFKDELLEYLSEDNLEEWLEENIRPEICFDMDIKGLLRNTPNQTVLVVVHSNYDCINSTDKIDESENYLSEVWQRVKSAINEQDYLDEFVNCYTAELLCFVANMSIEAIAELVQTYKTSPKNAKIFIPKGSQFGFFGAFHGSGSPFEHYTIEDLTLENDAYDGWDIMLDLQQTYSMKETYGDTSWVQEGYFKIVE